jgi:uncharacterized membrane protein YkvA (DUF1232 family)
MKWITVVRTLHRYWKMAHDPRTPAYVRYLIYFGVAYSVMPADLLPDFIPGLGLIDDAAILPGIIALAMILIPQEVKDSKDLKEHIEMEESQQKGKEARENDPPALAQPKG